MRLRVRVKPHSRKDEVKQIASDAYEVRTTAPPEKGKANRQVILLLAEFLRVSPARLVIIRGETAREKVIEVKE